MRTILNTERAAPRCAWFVIGVGLLCGGIDAGIAAGEGSGTSAAEATIPQLLEEAKNLEADHRLDEAVGRYRAALDHRPDDDEIRGRLARVLSWQGRYDEAVGLYRDILTRHPADLDVRVALARVLSWQKQFDESERLYRDALDEAPIQTEAKRGLADVLAWTKRPAEALPLYEEVLRETRDPEVAQRVEAVKAELRAASRAALGERVAKARELAWQKRYDEAERQYRAVLSEDPMQIEARQGLADTLYWSGRYSEALALYETLEAETHDPELPNRIQAVKTEILLSARAPISRGAGGLGLPFRDYLKVGYSHYTYTNDVPDERDWLIEAAKPIGDLTLVGRVEPLNRFGLHDTPVSGELYSPLWGGAWGYLSGSAAFNAKFVPMWSMGGEIYQGLGRISQALSFLEVSFGYKHMEFRTAGIELLTPGLTVYFPGNLWLTEKLYYVPDQGSMTLSSQLTWRPTERLQVFASGGYGTAGERIVTVLDFVRVKSTIWQGGIIFPITSRVSGEASGYYEDRGALYVRRGGTFNLIWHW